MLCQHTTFVVLNKLEYMLLVKKHILESINWTVRNLCKNLFEKKLKMILQKGSGEIF